MVSVYDDDDDDDDDYNTIRYDTMKIHDLHCYPTMITNNEEEGK